MSAKLCCFTLVIFFSVRQDVNAQHFSGSCAKLTLPSAPTKVSKTYIRKGFGEFGAARKGGDATHKGVDLTRNTSDSDAAATAVYAIASGTIAYSRVNGSPTDGYGNVIVVDHGNGCYSMYAHLASKPFTPAKPGGNLEISVGDSVNLGQLLGYFVDIKSDTASTGNAVRTDPAAREQVHIQMIEAPSGRKDKGTGSLAGSILREDGITVDPTSFLLGLGYKIQ